MKLWYSENWKYSTCLRNSNCYGLPLDVKRLFVHIGFGKKFVFYVAHMITCIEIGYPWFRCQP